MRESSGFAAFSGVRFVWPVEGMTGRPLRSGGVIPRNGFARSRSVPMVRMKFFGSHGPMIMVRPVPPSGPFLERSAQR